MQGEQKAKSFLKDLFYDDKKEQRKSLSWPCCHWPCKETHRKPKEIEKISPEGFETHGSQ